MIKSILSISGTTVEGFLENVNLEVDGGVLIIPRGVTNVADMAFINENQIEEIIFPDTVKTIGETAFSGCLNLRKIIFESSDVTIKEKAFYKCPVLRNVVHDSEFKQLYPMAFGGCYNLSDKDGFVIVDRVMFDYLAYSLSPVVPEGVEIISAPGFSGCKPLESVQLPNSLIAIGDNVFDNCLLLSKIDIPAGVKYISSYAFDEIYYTEDWNNNQINIISGKDQDDLEYPDNISDSEYWVKFFSYNTGEYDLGTEDETIDSIRSSIEDKSKASLKIFNELNEKLVSLIEKEEELLQSMQRYYFRV